MGRWVHAHTTTSRSNQYSSLQLELLWFCYRTRRFVSSRHLTFQVSDITSCLFTWWYHKFSYLFYDKINIFLIFSFSCRYKELLRWAASALSAQGLNEDAVNQTLLSLSRPVEMEDVRREMSQGPNGGAFVRRKRLGSGVDPKAKRSCR